MLRTSPHLTEEHLLLAADGELSLLRMWYTRRHLAGCALCRARMTRMQRMMTELGHASREAFADDLPSPGDARARLRMRLAAAAGSGATTFAFHGRIAGALTVGVLAGVVILGAAAFALRWSAPDLPDPVAAGVLLLPDTRLTPGAARAVPLGEICSADRRLDVRPITPAVHRKVFRDYGADYTRADEYELDHLVTPELGGTQDTANLWPQPYRSTPWNAYVKDELERLLHQRVCQGEMALATAQDEIATDWIAAYRRHFRTERPLRDYIRSPLTIADRDVVLAELEEMGIPVHLPGRGLDHPDTRRAARLLLSRASGEAAAYRN